MNKSPEEQYEFSLMMADKMIGLDELYKTLMVNNILISFSRAET